MNTSRLTRWSALALMATLTAAACGGGGDDTDSASAQPAIVIEGDAPVASPTPSTAASTPGGTDTGGAVTVAAGAAQTEEEKALAFAQCMRDEGVDFPDPTIGADGSVQIGGGTGATPPAFNDPAFTEAFTTCQPMLEGASFLPDQGDLTEIGDSLLEVAQCLRDQGIDVDDPDLSGGIPIGQGGGGGGGGTGPGIGLFGPDFDPDDPETAAALEECGDVFANLPIPGAGN